MSIVKILGALRSTRGRFLPTAWVVTVMVASMATPGWPDGGGGQDIESILKQLEGNVRHIDQVEFKLSHLVEYRSIPPGVEQAFGDVRQVDYNRSADTIDVKILLPVSEDLTEEGVRFEEEAFEPPTKAMFTGYPLWIMDPKLQVEGAVLSLAPTAPADHVVLVGEPAGENLPAALPHWEALIDQKRNRVISVTQFADSGEVHITIGFEDYTEFLNGRVLLPLVVHSQEFARRNTLSSTDRFTDVVVRGSGSRD